MPVQVPRSHLLFLTEKLEFQVYFPDLERLKLMRASKRSRHNFIYFLTGRLTRIWNEQNGMRYSNTRRFILEQRRNQSRPWHKQLCSDVSKSILKYSPPYSLHIVYASSMDFRQSKGVSSRGLTMNIVIVSASIGLTLLGNISFENDA
jgi:hypothetical protein